MLLVDSLLFDTKKLEGWKYFIYGVKSYLTMNYLFHKLNWKFYKIFLTGTYNCKMDLDSAKLTFVEREEM